MTQQRRLNIGITGGIGSGKTTVCRIFSVLGIAVYDADREAKELMNKHAGLRASLIKHFGSQVYNEAGELDRAFLSSAVFQDAAKLDVLNGLVHPVVIQAGIDWMNRQTGPYSVKEAALLFESGSYQANDYNILVFAPVEERIRRVMRRDGMSRQQVQDRINNQMPEDEKMKLADFVIYNDGVQAVIPQVLALHERFIKESRNT